MRPDGLKTEQVKHLKELETENTRLRKAVSDLTLDKLILQEAARGKLLSSSRRALSLFPVLNQAPQLHRVDSRAARNLVEQFLNKSKQCQRTATCFDGLQQPTSPLLSHQPFNSGSTLMNPRPKSFGRFASK